ncbi:hypothetical protein SteCoe_32801 [Stentor coeruleus]|uniref:Uncharacterized protein n=1 Tax=Stentor coeruleus TaxID=5963 RepID=A0A1R2AY92_9CILI|nr:hypothetical protein SteCoe_32801 [Stentor coeruleus]
MEIKQREYCLSRCKTVSIRSSRLKSSRTVSSTTQLSLTQRSLKPKPNLLEKLQNRKGNTMQKVSSEYASVVIKAFILPLMNDNVQSAKEVRRLVLMNGLKPARKENTNKLSIMLNLELKLAQKKLSKLKRRFDVVNSENEEFKKQIEEYKKSLHRNTATYQDLSFYKEKYGQPEEKKSSILAVKTLEYKFAAQTIYEKMIDLYFSLHKEQDSNSFLRKAKIQSKFYNVNNMMISAIVGEMLKNIYLSNAALFSKEKNEYMLRGAVIYIRRNCDNISLKEEIQMNEIKKVYTEIPKILDRLIILNNTRSQTFQHIKSMKFNIISKVNNQTTNLKQAQYECDKLYKDFENLEIKYSNLLLEFESTREKVNAKEAQDRKLNSELLCKVCLKNYFEDNNFNWSCCRHTTEWNGFTYWCCGEKFKNSLGCIKSKHIPENFAALKTADSPSKNDVDFCVSCKEQGHMFNSCSKDPNGEMNVKSLSTRSRSETDLGRNRGQGKVVRQNSSRIIKYEWNADKVLKKRIKIL